MMEALRSDATWILIVAPRKSNALEILSDLQGGAGFANVAVELGTTHNMFHRPQHRTVRIASAALLLQSLNARGPKPLQGLDLVICENLDQLDASYELGVSLLRHSTQYSPTRFVGISNSLNDATDLAAWLDVDQFSYHSFRPTDRGQSLMTMTQTFTVPQSAALFKVMAKPAHMVIQGSSSAIVFVPSRGQTYPVARDLLTRCALEDQSERGYLDSEAIAEAVEYHLVKLQDKSLKDFVSKGVGFFHDGIKRQDRSLMLQLYAEGIIRVMIVSREACWFLPIRADVVVVMGTQYIQPATEREEQRLREYDLTEIVRMQSRAVTHSGAGQFHLFCQAESRDTYARFLNDGLPLESSLPGSKELVSWYQDRRKQRDLLDKQSAVDALSFTFLAQRIVTNPAYYDCQSTSRDKNLSWIADQLAEGDSLPVSLEQATGSAAPGS
ncbi:hypothetical protein D9758_001166 [Tetrapyrgos nigripes]|uniref:Ig-like domain-containing protein n=1 Tax=Tetrapyrgos nigripes TaxID=182062 RepID=A0A8H5GRU2_9AGAR|nr:hypothetical protein D9758_001166 [Tetrapyrgos nigripes]